MVNTATGESVLGFIESDVQRQGAGSQLLASFMNTVSQLGSNIMYAKAKSPQSRQWLQNRGLTNINPSVLNFPGVGPIDVDMSTPLVRAPF